ncbi:MAG: 4Fe-4S binding protein [Firmicutes bacterium]|nr:4Fe-4S binding protein [Bacillota bacterium]
MVERRDGVSRLLARARGWIQAAATLLSNVHLANFFKGTIYQGPLKTVCVPGLNCYSCPAATASCPIGAFQAAVGSSAFRFSYYITGFLILLGVLLGRFLCGFLCPFGWFQEWLHKIPSRKFSGKRLRPLRWLKYIVLLLAVVFLPMLAVDELGMGEPWFCKYLCPQGILQGAIPMALTNAGVRAALGPLFTWKAVLLGLTVLLSVVFYRPFCKWLCPLGAFYGLFNRISLLQMQVDKSRCVACGQCAAACKMDVDVTRHANHSECIRCGMCVRACPQKAICYTWGFGGKPAEGETSKETNLGSA